jgi:hypothetical protein
MRNLLGRLHARRLPELLRIADAWGVPLHSESKGEVVAALYRALTDPRTVRDIWDRLTPEEREIALALADFAEALAAPTLSELARRLDAPEDGVRETALGLYRTGILAREGDDEPLPVGVAPRLLMPRELALQFRRIQDEMASGDLARAPLRVLIALLDDAELEGAARLWGMRALPGVSPRQEIARRLLRLVNDRGRVQRVVQSRGRDAAAIWRIVRAAQTPVALSDAAVQAGLGGVDKPTAARLRAALTELEGSLLVWHAYRADGTRWLFVPQEIREPGEAAAVSLPPLQDVRLDASDVPSWCSPDAFAWDLLTLLRLITTPRAPVLAADEPAPRWLGRAAAHRLWFGGRDGVPTGYLELQQTLARAEGVLAVDEESRPPRVVAGPQARAWRSLTFAEQTDHLREQWLRLPRWVEGEPAGIVEVWGADWRGMRPRLLAALADPQVGLTVGEWVTLESLAARIAAQFPALLGPSFMAATARLGGEAGAGVDEDEARIAALGDIVAFELAGPFVWFGITSIHDRAGQPRAVSVTEAGAARSAPKPPPPEDGSGEARAPLVVDPAGEITLQTPSPARVWALSAFTEPVDLGQESHYRLTPEAIGVALASGVEREQIVTFLERSSGRPLPPVLATRLTDWMRAQRQIGLRRAIVLTLDDAAECESLLASLRARGWTVEPHGTQSLLVLLGTSDADARLEEERLFGVLREAGHAPRWDAEIGALAVNPGAAPGEVPHPQPLSHSDGRGEG